MKENLVSIIIPFYSNVEWLIQAVASVKKQTYKNYEIIIINDGSKENISFFISRFKNEIIYREKINAGPGSARNLGIDLANGKYIAFLDSDDLWETNKLKFQVKMMEESNAIWSHTHWAQFIDVPTNIIKRYISGNVGYIYPRSLLSTNIATPCVMIRTDYLKQRNYLRFNEKMRFGQDYYFWLLLSLEQPVYLVPEILSKARLRGTNAVKRARVHLQVRSQIWRSLKDHPSRIFYRKRSLIFIRQVYFLCDQINDFITWVEGRKLSIINSEKLSKVLFLFPYSLFKFLSLFYNIRQKSITSK